MDIDLLKLVDVLALSGDLSYLGVVKVLVIGDALLDCYISGVATPLSAKTATSVVTVNAQKQIPGGAANTAINVCSLGGDVTFLSVVGDDREGVLLRQILEKQGISTKYVLNQKGRQTAAKHQVMAESELLVRLEQGSTDVIASKTEQALIAQLNNSFANCDAVIVSDYNYGVLTARVISAIAQLQSTTPRVLVVDSNRPAIYSHLDVTAVKLNYEDATHLLGVEAISLGESDTRANQITTYEKQLLELTKAQITAVAIDEEEAIAFKQVSHISKQLSETVSQLRINITSSTFISALTLALATKTTKNPTRELERSPQKHSLNEKFPLCPTEKYLTNPKDLIARVDAYRAAKYRIVFTNGCFDILHAGHVSYLNRAQALGDILIIGVNSDISISRLKGANRPINPLSDRIQVLAALGCVDLLIAFDEDTPIHLIELIQPDVYVKGGDYTRETLPETAVVEQLGGVIEILPFVENRSTTSIIQRILQAHLSKDDITR